MNPWPGSVTDETCNFTRSLALRTGATQDCHSLPVCGHPAPRGSAAPPATAAGQWLNSQVWAAPGIPQLPASPRASVFPSVLQWWVESGAIDLKINGLSFLLLFAVGYKDVSYVQVVLLVVGCLTSQCLSGMKKTIHRLFKNHLIILFVLQSDANNS